MKTSARRSERTREVSSNNSGCCLHQPNSDSRVGDSSLRKGGRAGCVPGDWQTIRRHIRRNNLYDASPANWLYDDKQKGVEVLGW